MSNSVVVHKGRTVTIIADLGEDISGDSAMPTSEIRATPEQSGTLIATWSVAYPPGGDGTNGEVELKLDNTITGQIVAPSGYMDIKRVIGGEPIAVFDQPLEVEFRGTVTA